MRYEPSRRFRTLAVAACLWTTVVGCAELSGTSPWNLQGPNAASETEGADVTSADTGADSATTVPSDRDTGVDDTEETDRDTETPDPDAHVTDPTGWYRQSFETSSFTPEGTYEPGPDDSACRFSIESGPSGERWWARGLPTDTGLRIVDRPDTYAGLFEMSGNVTGKGEYGHLGGYDRRFDVISHELKVCETFDALRGCAVPERGHDCYDGLRRYAGEGPLAKLERHVAGPTDGGDADRYRWVGEFGRNVADGGSEVVVEMTLPDRSSDDGLQTWSVEELANVTVRKRCRWFGGIHTVHYRDDVRGWVRRPGSPHTSRSDPPLKIYLETGPGTREEERDVCSAKPMAVWGHFAVDEVIGHP